jgi:hypothetical protein
VVRATHLASSVAVPVCLIVAPVAAADVLILRGGTERQGVLQSCSATACVLDQKPVPRETIEWIGLAGQPPPPPAQNPTMDEAHGRGGGVTQGKLVGIDASGVEMDSKTIPRGEVAWIHLGRAAVAHRTPDWRGTFIWSAHQEVPAGPQDWEGSADLALSDDGKGGLNGTFEGKQLQTLRLSYCNAETHGTLTAELTGTIRDQRIILKVVNGQSDWPASTKCVEGGTAGTGAPVFKWPQLDEAFAGMMPDGAGNFVFDRGSNPYQPYPTTMHYTLKLTPAK